MVNHVLLDPHKHLGLAVLNPGDTLVEQNNDFALLVPSELVAAQCCYPIFLQKDINTGHFFISALLGFQDGENLFLNDKGWDAPYIPLSVARQPFLITKRAVAPSNTELLITVDMDSGLVVAQGGQRLFDDAGQSTKYLSDKSAELRDLHEGLFEVDQLIDVLVRHNLIESALLKISFNRHKSYHLDHLYTINQEALSALDDGAVLELFRLGYLEKIHAILHSQVHVGELIRRKSRQDAI
jgi:hypothetical protein